MNPSLPATRNQRGAALVIVLLLLLVMTLLGLASLRATVLEERMTGALFDRSLAFQAAEAALREGEAFVNAQAVNIVSDAQARDLFGTAFDCTATGVVCESNPNLVLPSGSAVATGGCAFGTALWRAATPLAGAVDAAGAPQFCIEFTGMSSMPAERLSAELGEAAAGDMILFNYRVYARSADPGSAPVLDEGRAVVTLQSTFVISRV